MCPRIYVFCLLVKAKTDSLVAIFHKYNDEKLGNKACTITLAVLQSAMRLLEPAGTYKAAVFCKILKLVLSRLRSSGCDMLIAADAVPVIFDLLRRWPAEAAVVQNACIRLDHLACYGSTTVKFFL